MRNRFAAAVTAALVVAACSGGGNDDEADSTTTVEEDPTTTVEEDIAPTSTRSTTTVAADTGDTPLPPVPRQPLTGEELDGFDEIIDRPALAVKIDNHPLSRENHTGLAVADVVFEELVEGGLTRFAAVFHSQDADPVGPVRSGRAQDVDLLVSFKEPLFAWSGGNPGVTRLVANSLLTDLNWQTHVNSYQRGPGRGPHNLYTDTETLWALTPDEHPGPPPQQFVYLRDGETFDGEPVAGLDVQIGNVRSGWEWNEETGTFERSQVGTDHVDKTYGRIGATNVIVMVVEYKPGQIDASSPEAQTVGDGPAFIFSDGQVIEGRWRREITLFPIEFVTLDGDIIPLSVGNTWIQLAEAIPSDDIANPDVEMSIRPVDGAASEE